MPAGSVSSLKSEVPQHFRSFEKQATCDGCFALQSICSVISLHSVSSHCTVSGPAMTTYTAGRWESIEISGQYAQVYAFDVYWNKPGRLTVVSPGGERCGKRKRSTIFTAKGRKRFIGSQTNIETVFKAALGKRPRETGMSAYGLFRSA